MDVHGQGRRPWASGHPYYPTKVLRVFPESARSPRRPDRAAQLHRVREIAQRQEPDQASVVDDERPPDRACLQLRESIYCIVRLLERRNLVQAEHAFADPALVPLATRNAGEPAE